MVAALAWAGRGTSGGSARLSRTVAANVEPQPGRLYLNVAGHGARQTPRDRQPQPGSALTAPHRRFGLLELAEQSRKRLGRNADPGIFDRDRDPTSPAAGLPGCGGGATVISTPPASVNLMALPTRLVMIWRNRTSSPSSMARQLRVDSPGDVDPLLVGLRRQQLDHALHAVLERQRRRSSSCSLSASILEKSRISSIRVSSVRAD